MSRRLETNRFSRSASSCKVASSSSRSASPYFSGKLRRLDTVPMIEASGVRRSCEIEVSSAARSRSVSASTRASSSPLASEMRSIATAAWSHSASSSRRSSGVSNGPGASRSIPITPTGPLPVRSGRNSRLPPGKRVGAAPGGMVVLPAPARRRHIGRVEPILRRIARRDLQPFPSFVGISSTVRDLQHRRDLIGGRP